MERYNNIFTSLKEFYDECSKIRYLTSLVAIPKLPDRAPQFTEDALKRFTGSQAFHKAVEQPAPKRQESSNHKSSNGGQTTVVVQIPVQQQQQPAPQQTDMAPGMYDVELMQRINTDIIHMQSSLRTATAQNQQDQSALNELRERFETPRGGPRN